MVRSFRKYERRGRVAFDHGNARDVSLLLLCVSTLMWLAYWLWPGTSWEMDAFELFVVLVMNAAVVCAPLLWASSQSGRLEVLSDQIARKWLWLDRGLVDCTHLTTALWGRWFLSFGEFTQGDEKPDLTSCVAGVHEGAEHSFEYFYYTFDFTVVRDVGSFSTARRDRDAVAIRTVERRYGIVCDFPYARGVAVVSGCGQFSYPAQWRTASSAFNAKFRVHAESEQEAARFLSPLVVLAIERAAATFTKLNIEINDEGKLCLSFDNDLLNIARTSSLATPVRFESRLTSEKQAPGLTQALELIHALLKYSDNNFGREERWMD